MRFARFAVLSFMFLACAGLASANSIADPGTIVKGGGGPMGINGLSTIIGTTFNISAPTGTGTFDFINGNNFRLTSLDLTFTPGGPAGTSLFSCSSLPGASGIPAFTNCFYSHFPNSPTSLKFFGGAGIKAGGEFEIQLFGWPTGLTSSVVANTPEPTTLSMLLLGAGAAFLRRKRLAV